MYAALVNSTANPEIPQAFINYLVFDENMNLMPAQSGAIQIGATAGAWQAFGTSSPLVMSSSGYIAIYISTSTRGDIFIDPITITAYQGQLLQEQNYYPFGLAISEGDALGGSNVKNKFKHEGNEVYDDLGLNVQDFHARQYDYLIGRFLSLDPLADRGGQETMTPYHFCGNNPANCTDPGGMIVYDHVSLSWGDGVTFAGALYLATTTHDFYGDGGEDWGLGGANIDPAALAVVEGDPDEGGTSGGGTGTISNPNTTPPPPPPSDNGLDQATQEATDENGSGDGTTAGSTTDNSYSIVGFLSSLISTLHLIIVHSDVSQ